jgi:hypothetical protein
VTKRTEGPKRERDPLSACLVLRSLQKAFDSVSKKVEGAKEAVKEKLESARDFVSGAVHHTKEKFVSMHPCKFNFLEHYVATSRMQLGLQIADFGSNGFR